MQRDRKWVLCWLCAVTAVLGGAVGNGAFAQSATEPVPDHAALIGVPMSAAEVLRTRARTSDAQDVQRRIAAAGLRRSAADRAASDGLNRALARMPETVEQALRQAAADRSGAGVVLTSRQEIEPMYAVPLKGGGMNASHGVNDNSTR